LKIGGSDRLQYFMQDTTYVAKYFNYMCTISAFIFDFSQLMQTKQLDALCCERVSFGLGFCCGIVKPLWTSVD
jgi:hypothetical protein